MEKHKIILDCDPGHDDAVAIMLAGRHEAIDLLAITVVAGNHRLEKTAKNALNICEHLALEVPVAAGMGRPLVAEQVIAEHIHGASGLDGTALKPASKSLEATHAVDLIIELLMDSEGDITLVPTGPLTNIAMALRREPTIVPKIKQIILMGGAYQFGNVTPAAEFNIYVDPEAAHIVFTCGRPLTMMGLDVTHQALATPDVVARIQSLNNKASDFFVDLMGHFTQSYQAVSGLPAPPVHDPVTIAYLVEPALVQTRPVYTTIELRSENCYGRTLCDLLNTSGQAPNVNVGMRLDFDRFWNWVYETLRRYG